MPCHPDRVRRQYADGNTHGFPLPKHAIGPLRSMFQDSPLIEWLHTPISRRIPERRAMFEALIPDRYKPA